MRRRLSLFVLFGGLASACALFLAWVRPYDAAPWLEDLAVLEQGAGTAFANLEWHAEHGVDLPTLHRRTDSLIRDARADRDARAALRAFAAAFHDGHFAVVRPTPTWVRMLEARWRGRSAAAPTASMTGAQACAALGYDDDPGDGSLLAGSPAYRALSPGPFPTGIVQAPGERAIGVVRIGAFGIERFRGACAAAWPRVRDSLARPACDEACSAALRLATGDVLLAELRRALDTVRAAGAEAVVVDLTGNGGGNEWVDPAARQFTARPLQGQRLGFVRHPHWRSALADEAHAIDSALHDPTVDPLLRPLLVDARARLDTALAEVATPCERPELWTHGLDAADCRQLVTGRWYSSGALPWLPADLRQRRGADALFWPAAYRFEEGAWDGPLAVLVDHGTASASEQFAAMLRDAGAATIVGERTWGAGCGMTNGGIPLTLPNSGLDVRMPDCARLRADGTNEVAGITPDVPAAWHTDDDAVGHAESALVAIRRGLATAWR